MPGKRNFRRERQQHALEQPEKQAALYRMLVAQLPDRETALVGWPAILAFLHDRLQLCRPSGGRITYRMARRWAREHQLPVLRGTLTASKHLSPALSSTFALTAWTLTQWSSNDRLLFGVTNPEIREDLEKARRLSKSRKTLRKAA